MNNEAFTRGFFKAAVDSGLDPIQAAVLPKQASGAMIGTGMGALNGALEGGAAGLWPGALIGGLYRAAKEANKPRAERDYVPAILGGVGKGALIGGGVGAGLGAGGGVLGAAGDRIGQQSIMPDARVY